MRHKQSFAKYLHLGFVGFLGWLGVSMFACRTLAQSSNIVPDNTLGTESSRVGTLDNQGFAAEVIANGAVRGKNLFHSLLEFNVGQGRSTYFFSPNADIQNILARVTGKNKSEILGTLGTTGNSQPNLYLINPNGFVFGRDSSLDVGGSFVATTANAVKLGETGLFSATEPKTSNLLSINPSALLYNAINSQAQIVNRSRATSTILGGVINGSPERSINGLQVLDGKSLLLVGNDVNLERGSVYAPGGRVELGGLKEPGVIGLSTENSDIKLNFQDGLQKGDVSIVGGTVNTVSGNGGSIAINARNINVLFGRLSTGIGTGLGSVDSKAGDITLNATDKTTIGVGIIQNTVGDNAIGNGGNIRINTGELSFNAGLLTTATSGQGNADNIIINAPNKVSLSGVGVFSSVEETGKGQGGNIIIKTGELSLTNDTQLITTNRGYGKAGDVIIDNIGKISLDNSGIFSSVAQTGEGQGGNININTRELLLNNGVRLIASTSGKEDAGNVILNARDRFILDNKSAVFSSVAETGIGKGGNVEVITGELFVKNGAQINVSTEGKGNGGNVIIDASDRISLDGKSAIFNNVRKTGIGKGGEIRITTGKLAITDGAQLSAGTFGKGDAGNVNLNVRDTVSIDGMGSIPSGINIAVGTQAVGNGGSINISTGSLFLTNGAQLFASSIGQGNSGNITINARDTLLLDGVNKDGINSINGIPTLVNTSTLPEAIGNGGDINISAREFFIFNNATLSTGANNQGNAGNITINTSDRVSLNRGNVFSNLGSTGKGKGGNISIITRDLSVTNKSQLSSETQGEGSAGNISIDAFNGVLLDNQGTISSSVRREAQGKGGSIDITTGTLSVLNGAQLNASTAGQGNTGSISINARDAVFFDGVGIDESLSWANIAVLPGSVGDGGDIKINTGTLSITNGSSLFATNSGKGNTGNISINARDTVSFDGVSSDGLSSTVITSMLPEAIGKGGDINISTRQLSVTNGAAISTSSAGQGNAGNIVINSSEKVFFNRANAFSSLNRIPALNIRGRGQGGDIRVTTKEFSVVNGAQFFANTDADGKAGNIEIKATDFVNISGTNPNTGASSALFTSTEGNSNSPGGDIRIDTPMLRVENSAFLNAQTFGSSKGGNIIANVDKLEVINGGQLISTTGGDGQAGKITINAKEQVTVSGQDVNFSDRITKFPNRVRNIDDNSGLFVSSTGSGIAGDIEVNSPKVTLDNGGRFIAESASGDGGNINLNISDLLLMRRGSQISTSAGTAQQGGDGGNIDINSRFIVAVPEENSDISANAFTGAGGNVQITSRGVFGIEARSQVSDRSDITASSERGVQGVATINAPDNSGIQNSLNQLSENPIDPDALIANSCIARRSNPQNSTFFITGKGGLPERPGEAPISAFSTGTMQNVPKDGESAKPRPWKIGDPIVEPTGVYTLANGKRVLSRECN
jgi:filamentous hemagglutinin family protein